MRTNLARLIATAVKHGRASASDGRWQAYKRGGLIVVRHFSTEMIEIDPTTGEVFGISRGWGSMTDKCGIGRIMRGAGIPGNYATVFGGQS